MVAGNTTKIHMAVDAHGLPIDFEITGGEVHDCKIAPEFIEKLPNAEHTVADLSNPLILGRAKNQSKTLVFGVNYQNSASDYLALLE